MAADAKVANESTNGGDVWRMSRLMSAIEEPESMWQ